MKTAHSQKITKLVYALSKTFLDKGIYRIQYSTKSQSKASNRLLKKLETRSLL